MDDFKININRPKVSDEQAMKHMSFDKVMASYQAIKLPFYKTLRFWLWSAGGFTALVAVVLLLTYPFAEKQDGPNAVYGTNTDTVIKSEPKPQPENVVLASYSEPAKEISPKEQLAVEPKKEEIKKTTPEPAKETPQPKITGNTSNDTIPSAAPKGAEPKKTSDAPKEDPKKEDPKEQQTAKKKEINVVKPIALVCDRKTGDKVHRMKLGTVGKLKAGIEESREKFTVTSFSMEYPHGRKMKVLNSESFKFTKEMLYAADYMKRGDTIRFFNIKAADKEGREYDLDDVWIIVEDGDRVWFE